MNQSSDTSGLDPQLSRQVLHAIQGALEEEKVAWPRRLLKVLVSASAVTALLALPLLFAFREQMDWAWGIATGIWWLCLCAGFYLYHWPQPRLAVPGFWSPWVLAKLLLTMVFVTAVEILLCPSFVFLESPLPWNPFESLTHAFMEWGGMTFCMFACGGIFSGLGGLISFSMVARTLKGSSWHGLLLATAVAYLTQIPILLVQLLDEGLRPFALYWLLGGVIGTLLMALVVRARFADPANRRRHRES